MARAFVFLIIFFQNPNRVQKMFTDGGQISGTYVLALFSQFVLMVADRLCYLMRKGEWKLLLHFIESILVAWYVIQLPYLYYSSLQIGYGYPFNVHDQWIMKKINWLYAYLFIIYKAIPFMYEMRMLLDWTCSHTTMRFFEWDFAGDANATLVNELQFELQIPGSQFVAAGGIITLYIGLVYTLSRLIRSSIIGNKGDIMFGDLPTTNLLTEKVEMLYKVRTVANLRPQQISDVFRKRLVDDTQLRDPEDDDESDDDGDDAQTAAGLRKKETRRSALLLQKVMELEEEYYQMIIDIYRQPHLLYQHTGPYRHWWGSRTKGVSLCATPLPELNAPDGDELNTVPPPIR
eukprot:g5753.t1